MLDWDYKPRARYTTVRPDVADASGFVKVDFPTPTYSKAIYTGTEGKRRSAVSTIVREINAHARANGVGIPIEIIPYAPTSRTIECTCGKKHMIPNVNKTNVADMLLNVRGVFVAVEHKVKTNTPKHGTKDTSNYCDQVRWLTDTAFRGGYGVCIWTDRRNELLWLHELLCDIIRNPSGMHQLALMDVGTFNLKLNRLPDEGKG